VKNERAEESLERHFSLAGKDFDYHNQSVLVPRDTLRMEMGYCFMEMTSPDTIPQLEAG